MTKIRFPFVLDTKTWHTKWYKYVYIFLSGDHENNESKHTQEYSNGGEKLELSLWAQICYKLKFSIT